MALPGLGGGAVPSAPSHGGFLSGLGQFFGGSPAQTMQFPRFNPQQQDAFSQLLQNALQGLSQTRSDFGPIEQRARSQFQQQTVPSLAERFTSMGSGASLGSPAFTSQLGQAGAGLEEGLAAQRGQYGLQQQQMLMSLLGLGLTPQFESAYQPRQAGFLESGAQGLLSSLPLLSLLGLGGR